MVDSADKKTCSGSIGATWRMGPTFYWGVQEPIRENFEIGILKSAFQCNELNNNGFKFFS